MIIHGKERNFLFTVAASEDIAGLCRGGDLENIGELFEKGTATDRINAIIDVVVILNKGYESAKVFEDPEHVPDVITKEELKAIPMNMLKEIEQEALDSIAIGMGITVETEPEKN